jgi:hypothetical protein
MVIFIQQSLLVNAKNPSRSSTFSNKKIAEKSLKKVLTAEVIGISIIT